MWGCSDSSSVSSLDEETQDVGKDSKNFAGKALDISALKFRSEAEVSDQAPVAPSEGDKLPPREMTDEMKAEAEAMRNSASKAGWFYYKPAYYDPFACDCYFNGYWPGSIADIQVSTENQWQVYGYDWLTVLGAGSNVFNLNGLASSFYMYGYFGSGSINGWNASGQFVGTVNYYGGWPGGIQATFSEPVKWVQVYTWDSRYLDYMYVHYINQGPTGNAGPDQTINVGGSTSMTGSGADTDGGYITSYQWKDQNEVVVSNSATANVGPFNTPGVFTYTLTVTDENGGQKSDTMTITVNNSLPIANAGPDVSTTVGTGGSVVLNGSNSSDPDGHTLSYEWKNGSGTVIGNTASINVGPFSTVGPNEFTLTVSDGYGGSDSDEVTVTATNTAPSANAGANQTVQAGSTVSLNGSGTDADGHSLTYSWSNGGNAASTSVGPFNPGTYTFTLTVNDGYGGTDSDDVTITVIPMQVSFDIKPGDSGNGVNSKSNGVIPTAILGSAGFDVTRVNVSSLRFGPGNASEAHAQGHIEDVNGDGISDLVLHFGTPQSALPKGNSTACVVGSTTDGWALSGCDSVSVK